MGGGPKLPTPSPRPSLPGGGQTGSVRPSVPHLPNLADRPSVRPPAVKPPISRPDNKLPPGLSNLDRPSGIGRPGGSQDKPGLGDVKPRPMPRPLPGDLTRPGKPDRPSLGGVKPSLPPALVDRPSIDRPSIDRPSIDRPNINIPNINKPNNDRPVIGGGSGGERPGWNRPGRPDWGQSGSGGIDRPIIGGNRPNIGNEINIGSNNILNNITNINNNNVNLNFGNQFVNRPGWALDPGFARPGWGLWGSSWQNQWHTNAINFHHHGWYNGCWGGFWNSSWYAPVSVFAVGWGLGSLTNSWGMGTGFYNPYFVPTASPGVVSYDYSQPLVINNYSIADPSDGQPPTQLPQAQQADSQQGGFAAFDEGLAKFRDGDYHAALARFSEALKDRPQDPVIHEVRSLAQFALGDFQSAAAGLNSLLASAPGMDWTTMSGLYGNPDDYTRQLRRLEEFADAHPDDAASHFVLAYHYLVLGSKEAAIDALRTVVEVQPRDITARRMLDALSPPQEEPEATRLPLETVTKLPKPGEATATESDPQQTDLVGIWRAKAGGTAIELTITDTSEFTWKATEAGQSTTELTGLLDAFGNGIELVSPQQGTLAGNVSSHGPDAWTFKIEGSPANEPGLAFSRIE
jgi:tetratricopeptide (TPR) repeat protein